MGAHCLVLITCGDPIEGGRIAKRLVDTGLAAGVQLLPIESVYRWKGEVIEDQETLLIVKTRADRFEQIREVVEAMHSYQVPPVLMIGIEEASRAYLDWIDDSTQPEVGPWGDVE